MLSMNSSNRVLSDSDRGRGTLLRRLMSISMAKAVVCPGVCGKYGGVESRFLTAKATGRVARLEAEGQVTDETVGNWRYSVLSDAK